jgi:hypothetical protein
MAGNELNYLNYKIKMGRVENRGRGIFYQKRNLISERDPVS